MNVLEKIDNFLNEKEDSKYQKFFREKLEKFGVNSPNELSDEKKEKFFNEIKKEYKSKKSE